jgi:hypothetical protein
MVTEAECIEALREAARRLGESPTKAGYEELELRPASATIIRHLGGWNAAKEAAGLTTNPSTGPRVGEKPDDVDLPAGVSWSDLSVDQRGTTGTESGTPNGPSDGERGSERGSTNRKESGVVHSVGVLTLPISTSTTARRHERRWPSVGWSLTGTGGIHLKAR